MEDEAEVTVVPKSAFIEALERQPGAALAMVKHMAARQIESCHRLTQLSNGTVPQRLAALLCELAARAGIVNGHGHTRVPIPLTRSDLAQLCATTTESVIRQMSDLERRGVVQTATRGFVILDLPKLRSLATGDLEHGTHEPHAAAGH
jgi:CRP-like cAMP-binding protein